MRLDVPVHDAGHRDGVRVHGGVVGDAPEVDGLCVGLLEERRKRADRPVERVVGEDELVVVAEAVGAELAKCVTVRPDVVADVLALPDGVGDGFEALARVRRQRRVGDDEDVLGVGTQLAEAVLDVAADVSLLVVDEEKYHSTHEVGVLCSAHGDPGWSLSGPGAGGRQPIPHATAG